MAIIPGKWEVFRRDSGVTVVQSRHEGEDYMVARCYGDGDGDEVSTASLIAAAPDLLAACQDLLDLVGFELQEDPNAEELDGMRRAYDTAAAAIAKAEGKVSDDQ